MNLPIIRTGMPGWQRFIVKLGMPGLLGLALCALSMWAQWVRLPAERLATAQLESSVREARHRIQEADQARKASAASTLSVDKPALILQALMDGLPSQDSRTKLQSAVLHAAAVQGVTVQSIEWRGDMAPWSKRHRLWCQHMQLPVEGSYRAVRTWIDVLLREPALSIDAIDIQRKDLMSDQVKAQVSISLWWRMVPPARPQGGH